MKEGNTQFFEELDRKLQEKFGEWSGFRVRICNRIVELCFPDEGMAKSAMRSLYGFLSEEQGKVDATFLYWTDYFQPLGLEHATNAPGVSRLPSDIPPRMSAIDLVRRRFYYTQLKPPGEDYNVHGRTTVFQFSRWASASNLVMLHAATVGIDGKGVLVAGRSGSGKTTFALSCLLAGMDFVSDDYTLISASGPLQAMPLYSMIAVTPDICERFPELNEISALPPKDMSNGKRNIIVPAERFSGNLAVEAIILPVIGGDVEPLIRKVPPSRAMVHLLHSSVVQTGRERDTELMRQMAQRLEGVPVYEMRMSIDLEKNPRMLKKFIMENF